MSCFTLWILLASALTIPEGVFIEKSAKWTSINIHQKFFLHNVRELKKDLPKFSEDELKAMASTDHLQLNALAREHNIPITFAPFQAGEFGSLSLLNLNLLWLNKPQRMTSDFMSKKGEYPLAIKALLFSQDYKIYRAWNYSYPIVKIKTQSGDYVCMTIADKARDVFELSKKIKNIRKNLVSQKKSSYDAVIIPQFSYEGFVDISWMNGMHLKGKSDEGYTINKAVEYLRLMCNEKGCSVNAGVGLGFCPISSNQNYFIINKPFYFWVERAGFQVPLVEGYIEREALEQ